MTDPKLASYGSSNYVLAITQLAQTTLRSIIGRMELDRTFEERDQINATVVAALDEAALSWGVKVLRYEIKDLTPPAEILRSMQAQITAEREKRAVIATSEGRRQEQINVATGAREAAIAQSEGEKQAEINNAQGEASAILARAEATAKAIRQIAEAIESPGGMQAVNLRIAEQYINEFGKLAKTNNTLILPTNVADIAGMIATAMSVVKIGAGADDEALAMQHRAEASSSSPAAPRGWARRRSRMLVGRAAARVVVADLKDDEGQRARFGARAAASRFVRTDVTDEASAKAAIAAAVDGFGGLQGLVNCAGIVHGEKVLGQAKGRMRSRRSRAR